MEKLTAKDLLHKVVDFLQYDTTSDENFFNAERLKNNPPQYYRALQIHSMFTAFGVTKPQKTSFINQAFSDIKRIYIGPEMPDIEGELDFFLRGDFIDDELEWVKKIPELDRRIKEFAKENVKQSEDFYQRPLSIQWLFSDLLHFRIDIQRFIKGPSGFMEGFNIALFYSHKFQFASRDALIPIVKEMDETLALLIDPHQKSITIDELKSKFNYPNVNLDDVDSDWLMRNY